MRERVARLWITAPVCSQREFWKSAANFSAGDLIRIITEDGKEFARGLSNYSAEEVCVIKGIQTSEIEEKLGQSGF